MALINKLSAALQKEARELASKAGISLEQAAEEVIEKEGQKVFGLTAKPAIQDFPTSPAQFLGKGTEAEQASLRQRVAPQVEESITAREASKFGRFQPPPKGELVPVGEVKDLSGIPMLPPGYEAIPKQGGGYKVIRITQEKGTAAAPSTSSLKEAIGQNVPAPKVSEDLEKFSPVMYKGEETRIIDSSGDEVLINYGGPKWVKRSEIETTSSAPTTATKAEQVAEPAKESLSSRVKKLTMPWLAPLTAGTAMTSDTRQPAPVKLLDSKGKEVEISFAENLQDKPTEEIKNQTKKALEQSTQLVKKEPAKEDSSAATAIEEAKGQPKQPEALDRFKEQRDRAYDLYEKAKTRNEWLEVAQLLGQAFTQYAAAQAGMRSGRPMAGLQIPSIDYGARTEREARTLERTLKDIESQREQEQRLEDRLKREGMEQERIGLERRRVELAEREARTPKESTEDREIRRETRRGLQKKLDEQEQSLQKAIGAQQVIISGDISKKQKEKAQETLLTEAAAAGVDLEQVIAKSQVPGTIYGTNTDQNLVLTNLKAALADLQKRKQGGAVSETPVTSAPKQDSQILNYAKQYNLDYNQARDILIKRGYTPKE